MEELVQQAVVAERKRNRGWFQQGDTRINREGRPRGSPKAEPPVPTHQFRAVRTDRLMQLDYLADSLCNQLRSSSGGPRVLVTNLPDDCEIVGGHIYPNGLIIFIIRSQTFPRIAERALIPRFEARMSSLRRCTK
jgi:hypothetical protein